MRLKAYHWAIGVGLSAGLHMVLFYSGRAADQTLAARSAGTPDAVWGVAASDMLREAMPVDSPEPEPVEEVRDVEKPVETAEVEEPVTGPTALSETAPSAIRHSELMEDRPVDVLEPVKETDTETEKKKRELRQTVRRSASLGGPVGKAVGNKGKNKHSSSSNALMTNYSSRVLSHLRKYKRFPGGASRGTVRMVFVLGSNGALRSVKITGRSGSSTLDNAALAMVRRAAPFPSFPSGIGKSSLTFSVPVRFSP